MQTHIAEDRLKDPDWRESRDILGRCVHCGMCTATCPTYALLGDERDSPRGRIYLIKSMLENGGKVTPELVRHVDRCLSCLSCMTTCPSGVNYMHLIDHARNHIQKTYKRPLFHQILRQSLASILPNPFVLRWALIQAALIRPFIKYATHLLPKPLAAMIQLARFPEPRDSYDTPGIYPAIGQRKGRVALSLGCATRALRPNINAATIRVLNRNGIEVVALGGCCGSLTHHMGLDDCAKRSASALIKQIVAEKHGDGLDAVVINASGCGTTLKNYGHMFREHPQIKDSAKLCSSLTMDICEYLASISLENLSTPFRTSEMLSKPHHAKDTGDTGFKRKMKCRVAYHPACSLQHGQRIIDQPLDLLESAGYEVKVPKEAHICCGSAGVYNILQSTIANSLADRKAKHICELKPDIVATGNIGCLVQLSGKVGSGKHTVPVAHTIELLDYAGGGPAPVGIKL